MKKYIATYWLDRKITETIEIEARDEDNAMEVAEFHKETRGIKGSICLDDKK